MTLARTHSGSASAFAGEMNRYASSMGATNSYFVNPNGLPAMQHSTARDMARIAYHAYRNNTLRRIMTLPSYTLVKSADRGVRRLDATNKLLTRSSIYNGMKTGLTDASGRCSHRQRLLRRQGCHPGPVGKPVPAIFSTMRRE